jgi:ATP-binding cassette subfamily C (CFTR/MRP) protein 1
MLNWMVRQSCEIESQIISVERMKEYIELPQEAPLHIDGINPSIEWPSGAIEFKNYSARYREGLDLVLKDLSFSIKAKEKIGIVGRTGAGKSSLTLALFRLIEPSSGTIVLD